MTPDYCDNLSFFGAMLMALGLLKSLIYDKGGMGLGLSGPAKEEL
jgi:hypothetical protein